jgi:hypothetical protein
MVIPLRTMYVLVPAVLDSMRKIIHQGMGVDKLVALCAQFYLKMDDLIGSKGADFLEFLCTPTLV